MEKEKIVDYAFEKNEKMNILAIHPSRPLMAYLINIQRTAKITKGWTSGNESIHSQTNGLSNNSSNLNNSINSSAETNTLNNGLTVNQSIRIIDYDTRHRCLAKGVYHARPADCVFTINSPTCTREDIIKLAVVDRLANIYLYDLAYLISGLVATRVAVIRAPGQNISPFESIVLVWCPFVPCEDFEDGDGGLRLALATDSKIEIFAIDRLHGRTGELQRSDLKGAYKCIQDAHETNIVTLSISPDCSTISAASQDHHVTFYSSDIEDSGQMFLHDWKAHITDKTPIAKLFFLDDYPKLLEDSRMKFWGSAFIGTKGGQMILVDLRNWTVYQRINIHTDPSIPKNFDYRIDSTSRNIVAKNGTHCFIVQMEHNQSDLIAAKSKIVRTTKIDMHNPIYSFVIKHSSEGELHLFTISAYSLERYIINLNSLVNENVEQSPTPNNDISPTEPGSAQTAQLDVTKLDRVVEALFNKLNTTFHQGLEEFLNDIKCEMNDLNLKVIGLSRDVRKLHQQLQFSRHNKLDH